MDRKTKKIIPLLFGGLFLITLALTGCTNDDNTVKIATKPMTEQYILSEMIGALIEKNTDLKVEITKGIGGGTANIHPALVKGDFDLYPEYTGTAWNYVLKKDTIPDEETLYTQLTQAYADDYQLEWVGLYGFNNTFGLAVRKDIADQYNLKTYSDLTPVTGELTFGAEYDFFEREDGYDGLNAAYNYHFKDQVDLDIGLKYPAINNKEIDAMNIFTTDGQLSVSDITVLKDDKNFYPTYYCGTVVRQETLEKYPELRDVLMKMDQIITEDEMAKLNYDVEANMKDDKEVALDFLKSKDLI